MKTHCLFVSVRLCQCAVSLQTTENLKWKNVKNIRIQKFIEFMNATHFDGTVKCSILSFTCFINHAIAVGSYFVYVYNVQPNDHHPIQKFVKKKKEKKTFSFMLFERLWWYDVVMKCYVYFQQFFDQEKCFATEKFQYLLIVQIYKQYIVSKMVLLFS